MAATEPVRGALVVRQPGGSEKRFPLRSSVNIVGRGPRSRDGSKTSERLARDTWRITYDDAKLYSDQFLILAFEDGEFTLVPLSGAIYSDHFAFNREEIDVERGYPLRPSSSRGGDSFAINDVSFLVEMGSTKILDHDKGIQTLPLLNGPTQTQPIARTVPLDLDLPTQSAVTSTLALGDNVATVGLDIAPTVPLDELAHSDNDEEEAIETGDEAENDAKRIEATERVAGSPEEDAKPAPTIPITQPNIDDLDEERLVTQLDEPDYYTGEARTTQSEASHGANDGGGAEEAEDDDRGSVRSADVLIGDAPDSRPKTTKSEDESRESTPPPARPTVVETTVGKRRRTGPRSIKSAATTTSDEEDSSSVTNRTPDQRPGKAATSPPPTAATMPQTSFPVLPATEADAAPIADHPVGNTKMIGETGDMTERENHQVEDRSVNDAHPQASTSVSDAAATVGVPPSLSAEAKKQPEDEPPAEWAPYVSQFSGLTVAELRDELKRLGLDAKGKKEELIARLAQNHLSSLAVKIPTSQQTLEAATLLKAMKQGGGDLEKEETTAAATPETKDNSQKQQRKKRVIVEDEDSDDDELYKEVMSAPGLTGPKVTPSRLSRKRGAAAVVVDDDDSKDDTVGGNDSRRKKAKAVTTTTTTDERKDIEEKTIPAAKEHEGKMKTRAKEAADSKSPSTTSKAPDDASVAQQPPPNKTKRSNRKSDETDDEPTAAIKDEASGHKKADDDVNEDANAKPTATKRTRKQARPAPDKEEVKASEVSPQSSSSSKKSSSATGKKGQQTPLATPPSKVSVPTVDEPIRVMFTNIEPGDALKEAVSKLGGEIVETAKTNRDYRQITHLICLKGKMKRTLKLLHIMAISGPGAPRVVHEEWLLDSAKEGKALPSAGYVPFEGDQSMKHALSLRDRDSSKGLLEGMTILISSDSTMRPGFSELAPIVEQAGGDPKALTTESIKSCHPGTTVVIAGKDSLNKAMRDLSSKRKIAVCEPGWITQSLEAYSVLTEDATILSKGSFFVQ